MPTPEFISSPTPPTTPGPPSNSLPTFWWDQTNSVLNIWTTINTATGRQGWQPITIPAVAPGAINASAVATGPGQLMLVPAVVGSLGASVPNIPNGMVGVCYDIVGKRLYAVASGGLISGSTLFA